MCTTNQTIVGDNRSHSKAKQGAHKPFAFICPCGKLHIIPASFGNNTLRCSCGAMFIFETVTVDTYYTRDIEDDVVKVIKTDTPKYDIIDMNGITLVDRNGCHVNDSGKVSDVNELDLQWTLSKLTVNEQSILDAFGCHIGFEFPGYPMCVNPREWYGLAGEIGISISQILEDRIGNAPKPVETTRWQKFWTAFASRKKATRS